MAEQSDTTNPSSSSPDRAEKIRNLVNDLDDADIGIEAGTRNVYVQWSEGNKLWRYDVEGERLQGHCQTNWRELADQNWS